MCFGCYNHLVHLMHESSRKFHVQKASFSPRLYGGEEQSNFETFPEVAVLLFTS